MIFYYYYFMHSSRFLPLMGALDERRAVSSSVNLELQAPAVNCSVQDPGPVKPARSGNQSRGASSSFTRIMFYRSCFTAVFFHNAGRHATAAELPANLRLEKKKTAIKPEAQAASNDPGTLKNILL